MIFQLKYKLRNLIVLTLIALLFCPPAFVQAASLEGNIKKSFILSDHLGSTISVINESGIEESHTEYKTFGSIKQELGSTTLKKKFTGKELDESTGLYDYEARQYDAEIGRFVTADTADPKLEDPQTLNRYSYVLNNPLKYIDPDGHSAILALGAFTIPGFGALVLGGIAIIATVAVLSNSSFLDGTTFPSTGPVGASVYFARKASNLNKPAGSGRAAQPEALPKDTGTRRWGDPEREKFVNRDGSVNPGSHSTTDRRIKNPVTAKDRLDLEYIPSGYWDVSFKKGQTVKRGQVPGGESGGRGGAKEVINVNKLPKGSATGFQRVQSNLKSSARTIRKTK